MIIYHQKWTCGDKNIVCVYFCTRNGHVVITDYAMKKYNNLSEKYTFGEKDNVNVEMLS